MAYCMEATARNVQGNEDRVQLLLPKFIRRIWSAVPIAEQQTSFVLSPIVGEVVLQQSFQS